ncbi:MAG: hypothetical protein AB8F65_02265 [Woeseiaceae bacterium]
MTIERKTLGIVATLAFISGCASNLDYVAAEEPEAFGYSETLVENGQYVVYFNGKRMLRNDRLADYALRRAAELTVSNGYDWFTVLNAGENAEAIVSQVDALETITYEFMRTQGRPGLTRQQITLLGETLNARPGSVSAERPLPGLGLNIEMGRGVAPKDALSFDARKILGMLEEV